MVDRNDSARKKWFLAGFVIFLLMVAGRWLTSRMSPPLPDDPQELLRRAGGSQGKAIAQPLRKAIDVKGTSSSGAPVQAEVFIVPDKGGRAGFLVEPSTPLKEGETIKLKMPGGGSVEMSRPRDGEDPRLTSKVKSSSP